MDLKNIQIGDKFTIELEVKRIDGDIIAAEADGSCPIINSFYRDTIVKSITSKPVDIFVGLKFTKKNNPLGPIVTVIDIENNYTILKSVQNQTVTSYAVLTIILQSWFSPKGSYQVLPNTDETRD